MTEVQTSLATANNSKQDSTGSEYKQLHSAMDPWSVGNWQRQGPAIDCILLLCGLTAKRDVLAFSNWHRTCGQYKFYRTMHTIPTERDTLFASHTAALCLVRMCVLRHVSYRHKAHHFKSAVWHEQRTPYVHTTSVLPHVTCYQRLNRLLALHEIRQNYKYKPYIQSNTTQWFS
jgi:hypothetical protein